MALILNKNAILTGHVDSFCLACESHLRGDDDAVLHIAKPIHKKNLEATSFLDKYKDDHVRKVKKGYYCEYCNVLMKTATKVGPHVTEARHCERKASLSQPLRREGNGLLAFGKVFISENAWHGLSEDTCSVCDTEFDDAPLHKTETAHLLNLVLAEIEIDDGNLFRKVDDSTFQCLTCNLVCALSDMITHFDSDDHKKLYQECSDRTNNIVNEPKKEPETTKADQKETVKNEPSQKVIDKDAKKEDTKEPEDAHVKANEKLETEKKPKTEEKVEPVQTPTPEKKTEPEPEQEPKEEKKFVINPANLKEMGKVDKEICEVLGAKDYVAKDVNGRQWCILCDWTMDPSAVQPHLNGKHHQTLLMMHRERAEELRLENKEPDDKDEPKTNGKSVETAKENDEDPKADDKSKIIDAADEFQKNNIKLDPVNGSAFCRKCSKSVKYDFDTIKKHIDDHKNAKKPDTTEISKAVVNDVKNATPIIMNGKEEKPKQEKRDVAKESEAEEKYAKDNNLVYNKERNTAFCPTCVANVPPTLKNMKEHIDGISHKTKLEPTIEEVTPNVITKEASHNFIDDATTMEYMCHKDIVINDKYCLNTFSYLMMEKKGSKYQCQGCEAVLSESQIDDHKKNPDHESIMNNALVVSSEESEFIREIRPDVYHCGFCNQVLTPWSAVESHVKCTAHREAKTAANWRKLCAAPDVPRVRQSMQLAVFNRMPFSQMFGVE